MNLQKYFTTDRALPLNEIPTNMILLYIYVLYTTRHAYRTNSTIMVLRTVNNIFLNAFSKPRSTIYTVHFVVRRSKFAIWFCTTIMIKYLQQSFRRDVWNNRIITARLKLYTLCENKSSRIHVYWNVLHVPK